MQRDLKRLQISAPEFTRLSGLQVQDVALQTDRDRVLLPFLLGAIVLAFSLFGLSSQLVHHPLVELGLGTSPLALFMGWLWWGRAFNPAPLLTEQSAPEAWALYGEVVNFNQIVRSLNVNDQLQAAGNPSLSASVRQDLLKALQLVRQDLVRALKTERILRENQDVINELSLNSADLFTNNLASLQTLQLESQAADVEQYLTSAVQIALEVRDRLQDLRD